MSREIKFMGKRVDNSEWVYGNLIKARVIDFDTCNWVYAIQSEHLNNGTYYRYVDWEIDTKTICQFTGLKDKIGAEIYEGDIVKGKYYGGTPGLFKRIIGVVAFRNGKFEVQGKGKYEGLFEELSYGFEVMGNIHEGEVINE
jgi:uncharacterized phage protein (TIGR01671 family)